MRHFDSVPVGGMKQQGISAVDRRVEAVGQGDNKKKQ